MSIADDGTVRSLYFGDVQQSSIRLDRPGVLLEEYNRAMMSALIFRDQPRSVLLVGLGGCSLVHFLLQAFPLCTIHVAEISRKVIDAAYDYFLLPRDGSRLTVFHAAGQDFVMGQESRETYDLILSDAFDEGGPAAGLMQPAFLAACRDRLGKDGMFVVNLWSRPKDEFPRRFGELREALGGNLLKLLPGEALWNALAFWSADPAVFQDMPSYRQRARELQRRHAINFPRYLMCLCRQNSIRV